MQKTIRPITLEDRKAVMDIFNYYVENSFAAFPEEKLPYRAFDIMLEMAKGLPTGLVESACGETFGFGMLRYHNQLPVFARTAEVMYFIHPEHTGKGLGKMLLAYFEKGAAEKGITNILACVSSLNSGSIMFHESRGFIGCGRFREVGRKKGLYFDTIWLQKKLKSFEYGV